MFARDPSEQLCICLAPCPAPKLLARNPVKYHGQRQILIRPQARSIMLEPVELTTSPSCFNCVSWSSDGDLAVAGGEYVHILVCRLPYSFLKSIHFSQLTGDRLPKSLRQTLEHLLVPLGTSGAQPNSEPICSRTQSGLVNIQRRSRTFQSAKNSPSATLSPCLGHRQVWPSIDGALWRY